MDHLIRSCLALLVDIGEIKMFRHGSYRAEWRAANAGFQGILRRMKVVFGQSNARFTLADAILEIPIRFAAC